MKIRKFVVLRKISQLIFLCFFIYVLWSTTYPLTGLFSPQILFRADPLLMISTSLSARIILPGISIAVMFLVLTLLLGRFFCGWVCPLGTIIDFFGKLKRKKISLTKKRNAHLRKMKYGILALVFVFAFFRIQIGWVLDPLVIVGRVVSLFVIPAVTLGVDKFFIFLIQKFELYGSVYDFYQLLKSSILGIDSHFFSNMIVTPIGFLVIAVSSFFILRLWCRMICPLGACYAGVGWLSLLKRKVDVCNNCGFCRKNCRMGAITTGVEYLSSECILCMDCVYDCPLSKTKFVFPSPKDVKKKKDGKNISRANFLLLMTGSFFSLGFWRSKAQPGLGLFGPKVIRPPGVSDEDEFFNTCVRCGNCMKVCITNGLQPVLLESGWKGLWTPKLVPEIGYCEHQCTLCGQVCPTGAIPKLPKEQKMRTSLGLAIVDKPICLAWGRFEECLVCEEHCPVHNKAIKKVPVPVGTFHQKDGKIIYGPQVDPTLCIGCGICQNKCPVRPRRAIRVDSRYLGASFSSMDHA